MRFGIKGGLNLANQSISSTALGGLSLSPNMKIGFHVGVVLDAPLSDKISIQPSLLFSQKGFKLSSLGTDVTANLGYLEIPINFLYHATEKLSVGAGPYLGYGLSGTVSSGGKSSDAFTADGYKKLDFGLNMTAGYEVADGLIISANYSLGLANIADDATSTTKNNVIGFSVTKLFGSN